MYCWWLVTFLLVPALVYSEGCPNSNDDGGGGQTCQAQCGGPSVQPSEDPCGSSASSSQAIDDHLAVCVKQVQPRAIEIAMKNLKMKTQEEVQMAHSRCANAGDKAFRFVQGLQRGKPVVKQLEMSGFGLENCTDELIKLLGMKKGKATIAQLETLDSPINPNPYTIHSDEKPPKTEPDTCPYPRYICNVQKYRSFDGSCNNLQNPLWGRAMTPLKRIQPADYSDGMEEMRRAKDGSELPSPRLVSINVHRNINRSNPMHTLMLMQWGQFIDHDFTLTALTKLPSDVEGTQETVDVDCGQGGCGMDHSSCKPIAIPPNDPVFGGTKECLGFVRSAGVPNVECKMGPREQLNQLTSYIDGSQVYGSSKEQADSLRDLRDPARGRMKVSANPNPNLKKLLPTTTEDAACLERQPTCFEAGDERVNEQTSLSAQHTVWMRQHNRLEAELHRLNPSWDGERLYQECRKIIGALIQQVTYGEFLPAVLGPVVMKKYGLNLMENGFYTGYDKSVDAGASNIFATAAFRFGHSLITPMMEFFNKDYKNIRTLEFSELFFRPSHLTNPANDGVDGFLRGVCTSGVQKADRWMTDQVTSKLFSEAPPEGLGTDLASINIQRSRDHGVPGYNVWRTYCGLKRANSFEELVEMDEQSRETFKKLYKSVDDIDIFSAGLAEKRSQGSLLGPTFSCILGDQFMRLRKGDRFWYETSGQFSAAQLKEIRKVKLSKIICENGDNISEIQPAVFENPIREAYPNKDDFSSAPDDQKVEQLQQLWREDYNRRKKCGCLPGMDLKHFVD